MKHKPCGTPVQTLRRLVRIVPALAILLLPLPFARADAPGVAPSAILTEKVRPGDSWAAVRNRMCPLSALQHANPGLDPQRLHPDEIVRSPYVRASTFLQAHRAREASEARLAEARARIARIQRQAGTLRTLRRDLDRARAARASLRMQAIVLLALLATIGGVLAVALLATRMARRDLRAAKAHHQAFESRYANLRRSLQEIEVGLQRRLFDLLRVHGGKVVSEKEIEDAIKPVIHFARELKKKHAS
jgi:hypothetical protein